MNLAKPTSTRPGQRSQARRAADIQASHMPSDRQRHGARETAPTARRGDEDHRTYSWIYGVSERLDLGGFDCCPGPRGQESVVTLRRPRPWMCPWMGSRRRSCTRCPPPARSVFHPRTRCRRRRSSRRCWVRNRLRTGSRADRCRTVREVPARCSRRWCIRTGRRPGPDHTRTRPCRRPGHWSRRNVRRRVNV